MNILDETAAALPDVSHRLRDFLAPRMGRPPAEAASAAPEAQAAEAESGSEDESVEPGLCPATAPTRYGHSKVACTLATGHEGDHMANGTGNPSATWREGGGIDWDAVARAQLAAPEPGDDSAPDEAGDAEPQPEAAEDAGLIP